VTSPIAGNVWEATGTAMTTINFRSRFIVRGEGFAKMPAVADVAEFSYQGRRPATSD
jgi:hypothetical protein